MKIYTKTGDDGTTGLIGGKRVLKSDARIECYGTVDELNACLGWCACAIDDQTLLSAIRRIQAELFVIGSHLAAPDEKSSKNLPPVRDQFAEQMEREMDQATAELPELRTFILPGGSESAGRLHLARTVCRRAERLLVKVGESEPIEGAIVLYFNRLSDWLFVMARWVNHKAGVQDVPWIHE